MRVVHVGAADRMDAGGWVEAAPFRAHLRHLVAASGLSTSSVALLAGVSSGFADRLLHGRNGRPVRRISPDTARMLLRVTVADARAVRTRSVPAHTTVSHLHRLHLAGWSDVDLAGLLEIPHAGLLALLNGATTTCTQLAALRAATEVARISPFADESVPVGRAA